jgi:hypothetical protein
VLTQVKNLHILPIYENIFYGILKRNGERIKKSIKEQGETYKV